MPTHHPTPPTPSAPLISFIVTYYNQPLTMLSQCLDSILALPLEDGESEVIVVDDGSESSPAEGLQRYEDRLVYVRQRNRGVSVARNKGLQMATGRYIQFVDADDYLHREPYAACLDLLKTWQPDILKFFYTTSPHSPSAACHILEPLSGTDFMCHCNINGASCTYLFQRTTIGHLRFSEGIAYGEDEEFVAQVILKAERLLATDAQAYFYRQHEGSVTHNQERIQRRLSDTHRVLRSLQQLSFSGSVAEQSALKRRVAQLTMDYLYTVITLTGDIRQLESVVAQLREEALFPLPDKSYTRKYQLFRRLTATALGRRMLCSLLSKKR